MVPRLIDIHTHVNFNAFKEDSDDVICRALDNGVWMILVGSQIDTSRRAVEFAEKYPEGVHAAVGLHPIHLSAHYWDQEELGAPMKVESFKSRQEQFDYSLYKQLAENPKVVAIGECGLDYYRVDSNKAPETGSLGISDHVFARAIQQETLRAQIRLAREVKKPLMIHCRPETLDKDHPIAENSNAYEDCLRIFKEEKADEVGGNMHFFAGDWKAAEKFLNFGFYLSFTGVITFVHNYDKVIKNMPLERLMIETDAPYVAPVPYRGKRNEPLYVGEIAKRIAEIRGMDFNEVVEQTTRNAIRLFNLL